MMDVEPPFIRTLSERLSAVDIENPQLVMDAVGVTMAELVGVLKSYKVFADVHEAVTYEPETSRVTGVLYVTPGTWGKAAETLSFFVLKQGFSYNVEQKAYLYTLEI